MKKIVLGMLLLWGQGMALELGKVPSKVVL